MSARLFKTLKLNRGEKATALAYAAVVAMSAGMTILIMSGVAGDHLIWGDKSWFSAWVIGAGALSGAIGLSLARGWMGLEGILGAIRAVVGSIAVAIMASMIAGLLIDPLLGVVYGPVLLLTAFIAKPWLVVGWVIIAGAVHGLMVVSNRELYLTEWHKETDPAISQLSRLSQENLYRTVYKGLH